MKITDGLADNVMVFMATRSRTATAAAGKLGSGPIAYVHGHQIPPRR
jgi:hypothetical protein